jgi:hypothetical protein
MTLSLAHQNVKEKENREKIKEEGEQKKINISKNKKKPDKERGQEESDNKEAIYQHDLLSTPTSNIIYHFNSSI